MRTVKELAVLAGVTVRTLHHYDEIGLLSLGEMFVADPRFTAYCDEHATGLAVWVRDAITANAAR